MQIRTKLTLNYFGLVALLFFLSFILLYSILRQTRVDEFYSRLESKARTTGHLLLNTNQIDSFRLRLIDKSQKDTLSSRFIKIYNLQKRIIYTNKDTVHFKDVDDYWDRILSKKKIKFMYGNYSMLGMQFNGLTQDVVIITGAIDVSSVNKNKFLFDLLMEE